MKFRLFRYTVIAIPVILIIAYLWIFLFPLATQLGFTGDDSCLILGRMVKGQFCQNIARGMRVLHSNYRTTYLGPISWATLFFFAEDNPADHFIILYLLYGVAGLSIFIFIHSATQKPTMAIFAMFLWFATPQLCGPLYHFSSAIGKWDGTIYFVLALLFYYKGFFASRKIYYYSASTFFYLLAALCYEQMIPMSTSFLALHLFLVRGRLAKVAFGCYYAHLGIAAILSAIRIFGYSVTDKNRYHVTLDKFSTHLAVFFRSYHEMHVQWLLLLCLAIILLLSIIVYFLDSKLDRRRMIVGATIVALLLASQFRWASRHHYHDIGWRILLAVLGGGVAAEIYLRGYFYAVARFSSWDRQKAFSVLAYLHLPVFWSCVWYILKINGITPLAGTMIVLTSLENSVFLTLLVGVCVAIYAMERRHQQTEDVGKYGQQMTPLLLFGLGTVVYASSQALFLLLSIPIMERTQPYPTIGLCLMLGGIVGLMLQTIDKCIRTKLLQYAYVAILALVLGVHFVRWHQTRIEKSSGYCQAGKITKGVYQYIKSRQDSFNGITKIAVLGTPWTIGPSWVFTGEYSICGFVAGALNRQDIWLSTEMIGEDKPYSSGSMALLLHHRGFDASYFVLYCYPPCGGYVHNLFTENNRRQDYYSGIQDYGQLVVLLFDGTKIHRVKTLRFDDRDGNIYSRQLAIGDDNIDSVDFFWPKIAKLVEKPNLLPNSLPLNIRIGNLELLHLAIQKVSELMKTAHIQLVWQKHEPVFVKPDDLLRLAIEVFDNTGKFRQRYLFELSSQELKRQLNGQRWDDSKKLQQDFLYTTSDFFEFNSKDAPYKLDVQLKNQQNGQVYQEDSGILQITLDIQDGTYRLRMGHELQGKLYRNLLKDFAKLKIDVEIPNYVTLTHFTIQQSCRKVLLVHPPADPKRATQVTFPAFIVPANSMLEFGIGILPAMWQNSDGVQFVAEIKGKNYCRPIFTKYLNPRNKREDRHWHDVVVPLTKYVGEEVQLVFKTKAGKNNYFDHAGWSYPAVTIKK